MNYWAILAAAISAFLLGGLWYSKALFGRTWSVENGSPKAGEGHPAKVFGIAFLFSLIGAIAFACLIGPAPALETAVKAGALAGFGVAATSFGINYQFANRSFKLWLIDGGYHTLQFIVFGVILGLWH